MPDMPEIPEDITALSRDQLIELEAALIEHANALRENSGDAAAAADLARIAETLPAVGERVDTLDAEARRAAETVAVLDNYQRRPATAPAPPAPPADDPAPADVAPDVVDAEVTDVTDTVVDTGADLVPVAASGRTVADIAARAPQQRVPATARAASRWYTSLTAGAEIPGITASSRFESSRQLAEAVIARTHSLTRSNAPQASALIAQAHLPQLGEEIGKNESASFVTEKMMDAVRKFSVEQEQKSLVADSGFCGPTETIWDLCDPYVADGMVQLPDISIGRAGINYYPMPDLSCFNNYSWEFGPDELECMEKPCLEIPCPEPVEVKPGVIGACLTTGILQARSFPELVDRYVRGILVSHLMLVSKRTLEMMEAGSDPVVYDDAILGGNGFTAALFNAIEFQAEDLRADYLLAESEVIVVDLPRWVRGAIRADLANRAGVDLVGISNQRIDAMFRDAGVRVNWIKGWQDECVGAPGAQRAYPTTVRFLIYREGAWVRGLEPVIEMESLYDSALLRQNKFTRLFTEQALMVANLCTRSRVVTVPVCPDGNANAGGAGRDVVCFSEACTPGTVTCPPNVECPPLPCCPEPPAPPAPGAVADAA